MKIHDHPVPAWDALITWLVMERDQSFNDPAWDAYDSVLIHMQELEERYG